MSRLPALWLLAPLACSADIGITCGFCQQLTLANELAEK